VTVVGPDGSYFMAGSPVRRAISRGVLYPYVDLPPLVGGISKSSPYRFDVFIRDAVCAAADRVENMGTYTPLEQQHQTYSPAFLTDLRQVRVLVNQAIHAFPLFVSETKKNKVRTNIDKINSQYDTLQKLNRMLFRHVTDKERVPSLSFLLEPLNDLCTESEALVSDYLRLKVKEP